MPQPDDNPKQRIIRQEIDAKQHVGIDDHPHTSFLTLYYMMVVRQNMSGTQG